MLWRSKRKAGAPTHISAMWSRFSAEAIAAANLARKEAEQYISRGFVVGEWATPREDCLMLYRLVRYFERRHVFEIGTFIGTTANMSKGTPSTSASWTGRRTTRPSR